MEPTPSTQEVLEGYRKIADSYRENPDKIFSDKAILAEINDELLFEVGERITQETRKSYEELVTFFGEACTFI